MTTKVYELYPCSGGFSVKTVDYHGTAYLVAATSVRQAYAVAYKHVWIDPHATHPVGIMAIYNTKPGFELWCGCNGHGVIGGAPDHGAGIRAIRAAIDAHNEHCHCSQPPLIERRRRHKQASAVTTEHNDVLREIDLDKEEKR